MVRTAVLVAVGLLAGPVRSTGGDDEKYRIDSFAKQFPDCTTNVESAATHPAGAPVLITLVVTNNGKNPVSQWCGGPGWYPDAAKFPVVRTGAAGKTTIEFPENGQAKMGSGGHVTIAPDQTVRVPAALKPLPVGTYTLAVGTGKAA